MYRLSAGGSRMPVIRSLKTVRNGSIVVDDEKIRKIRIFLDENGEIHLIFPFFGNIYKAV